MAHTTIANRLANVQLGQPQGTAALQVIPLEATSHEEPKYRMLEEDVLDRVTVTEVDESGQVPILLVENTLDIEVFLMDGQELVGAKQNRILNADVMVPSNKKLKIPVSCVEAGRWETQTKTFSPGKAASSTMRSRKSERVYHSLKRGEGFDADQHEVWNDVADSLSEAKCSSPTAALNDAYRAREEEIKTLRQHFNLPDDAVGVAVCRDGKFAGMDLFDRTSTLQYFWESLVDSYLLESLGTNADSKADAAKINKTAVKNVTKMMHQAADGQWDQYDSPGLGKDHRHKSNRLTGTALVCDKDAVVHLQLFPHDEDMNEEDQSPRRSRVFRSYMRPADDTDENDETKY